MQERESYNEVFDLIMAGWQSQTVRALALFSVAEHVADGPLRASEIAEREGVDPQAMYRLLRAGVALRLLDHDPESGVFSGTELLGALHSGSPKSLKFYATIVGGPAFWNTAMLLPDAVRTGKNQSPAALGFELFEYFARDPEMAEQFAASMTSATTSVITAAVSAMPAGLRGIVADVGGSNGTFVAEVLDRYPETSGVVFDLPHVVPGVAKEAAQRGLAERLTGVGGDFFTSVPEADIYLLKWILHDWDNPSGTKILENIRAAMKPGARLYIVEMVVDERQPGIAAAMMDIGMLGTTGGRERSLREFDELLAPAGLKAVQAVDVWHPYQLITVEPV